ADYFYAVRASDPENDTLTFSLLAKPDGMSIDARTGFIRWRPAAAGTQRVVVQVSDALGAVGTQAFDVFSPAESAADHAPVITSVPKLRAAAGRPYQYQIQADDADRDALVYDVAPRPDGLQIDPATGLITWTPRADQVGSFRLTVSAADPSG